MKREIKFRAFWKDTGKIILDFNEEYIIDACNDNIFIVEQFTGLKDKNGVEIYEGDVCKTTFYNHATPNSELTQKVIFVQGGFALMSIGKDFENIIIEHDLSFVPLYYSQAPNRIEVIGNIHELPELLKH